MGKSRIGMIHATKLIESLAQKYTQREIAAYVGVTPMAVTSWKKGWYSPNSERMKKLLELFDGASKLSRVKERAFVSQDEASDSSASESTQPTE